MNGSRHVKKGKDKMKKLMVVAVLAAMASGCISVNENDGKKK